MHRVGLAVKHTNPETKWVVDWRDLWVDNHIYPGLPVLRWYETFLEHRFHRHADLVTTVSEPLARVLHTKTGKQVETILNGFDPEDYETLPGRDFFPRDGIIRILYTGSIYKGKRDPTPLFAAIARLKETEGLGPERVRVLFAGPNADVSELAVENGVSEFCEYLGFLPREDALRAQRDADVLLFLEFEAPGVDGILTGKLFEYLFAGKFILGVGVTERTSAGRLMTDVGHGRAVGKDVGSIVAMLRSWLRDGVSPVAEDNQNEIRRFSREVQAMKMLEHINKQKNTDTTQGPTFEKCDSQSFPPKQ